GAIGATISGAKNEVQGPADLAASPRSQLERVTGTVWPRYEALLRENNALDYDDLLLFAVRVLATSDRALERWQDRYQYILVDEYQDTNRAQYELLRYLAGFKQNLAVVGDDDQSVFSWRGADVRNILDFERDYPNATVVKLEQNYRSTQRILAYLGLVRNTQDSVALARVLNVPPRGIGDKTRTSLLGFARDQELTAAQALLRAEEIADVPARQRAALTSFGRLLERLRIDVS